MADEDISGDVVPEPKQEEPYFEDGKPTARAWRAWSQHFRRGFKSHGEYSFQGQSFTYITARQVQDRLDHVVGPGNWSTSFKPLPDGVVECTLTIFGVSKADVGYPNNPGNPKEKEPWKAAYSDALKRAAVQWGIGRYLYGDGE